jgi:hypothetical protein
MSINSIILSLKSLEHNLSHSSIRTLKEVLKAIENNISIQHITDLKLPYEIQFNVKSGIILNQDQYEDFSLHSRMCSPYYYQTHQVVFTKSKSLFNSNLLNFDFANIRRDSFSSLVSTETCSVIDLSSSPESSPSSLSSSSSIVSDRELSFELFVRFQTNLSNESKSENLNIFLFYNNKWIELVDCNITKDYKKTKSVQLYSKEWQLFCNEFNIDDQLLFSVLESLAISKKIYYSLEFLTEMKRYEQSYFSEYTY